MFRLLLGCLNNSCAGVLEEVGRKDYHYCENCKNPENDNLNLDSERNPVSFDKFKGVSAEKVANLDLVLVAPRHLFRMPYSLHEKTALASVVLGKEELEKFNPKDADPLKVRVRNFMPECEEGEAKGLLSEALDWRKGKDMKDKEIEDKKYSGVKREFKEYDFKDVPEGAFPPAINKLLKGMEEGRKRGLFVLITFLKALNFSPDYINKKVREWNEKNDPPLREGYVRAQIDWHLKQRKKILPPNYGNDAFYRDIGLIKEKQKTKNPIVDVKQNLWKMGK